MHYTGNWPKSAGKARRIKFNSLCTVGYGALILSEMNCGNMSPDE